MANRDVIYNYLLKEGKKGLKESKPPVTFLPDEEENLILNNIGEYPHLFILGFLMEKGMVSQRAWEIPFKIKKEFSFSGFGFDQFIKADPEKVAQYFQDGELHRYPSKMSRVYNSAINRIAKDYNKDASEIWGDKPKSATLIKRLVMFEGLEVQAATYAANLLYRDFKIPLADTTSIDLTMDPVVKRVFTRTGFINRGAPASAIQMTAREMYPAYPAIFSIASHELGDRVCLSKPKCRECELNAFCPKFT